MGFEHWTTSNKWKGFTSVAPNQHMVFSITDFVSTCCDVVQKFEASKYT
jgi:hypothetical protein